MVVVVVVVLVQVRVFVFVYLCVRARGFCNAFLGRKGVLSWITCLQLHSRNDSLKRREQNVNLSGGYFSLPALLCKRSETFKNN